MTFIAAFSTPVRNVSECTFEDKITCALVHTGMAVHFVNVEEMNDGFFCYKELLNNVALHPIAFF